MLKMIRGGTQCCPVLPGAAQFRPPGVLGQRLLQSWRRVPLAAGALMAVGAFGGVSGPNWQLVGATRRVSPRCSQLGTPDRVVAGR